MNWFHDMTDGPWWVDLTALAGAITAGGVIIRMVIWPGLKTIWKAVIAAPQLASGVGRLVEILETDILRRVETLEVGQLKHNECLTKHSESLAEIKVTMESLKEGK